MYSNDNNSNILSEYEEIETLGKGTFSVVKLGINKKTNDKVAIKILEKNKIKNSNDLTRLKREIHILRTFSHMNIIKTYEIKENKNNYFLIMEYCNHGELYNQIIQNKKLSEKEASYYYYQLINGLEYIHSNGIVHRDLKPENLLIGKSNILKIIDFGLSNFFNGQNLLKTPCGSPCYVSPEMVSGKRYNGFYIDIWSTGIILYGMLCGFLPFEDENNSILFKKIEECNIHYPDFLSKNCKSLLKSILVKDYNKRIKISEIKKHPFFLEGKEYFKKIHPELFMEEIIIPNDFGAGHYTDRATNSELLNESKNDFGMKNYKGKKPIIFKAKTLKININYNKIKRKNHKKEIYNSDNKNINEENLLKNLEKFIQLHSNTENQTFNSKKTNNIRVTKTFSNNYIMSNNEYSDNFIYRNEKKYGKYSNDSLKKNKKSFFDQTALKKSYYLELSENKENSKYRPITTVIKKCTKIKKNNIVSQRNPTNFELYGTDIKKNKGKKQYYNEYKFNSVQIQKIDKISNLHSYSNHQNSLNLSEKFTSTSVYTMENSFNKTSKSNYKNSNPIFNINKFIPNYYRNYKRNNVFNKAAIKSYQSITSKKIEDLYNKGEDENNKKTKKLIKSQINNLINHNNKIETHINENTKKILPKNSIMNLKRNKILGSDKIGKNLGNMIQRKKVQNYHSPFLDTRYKDHYLNTEVTNIQNKKKKFTTQINLSKILFKNKIKKTNSALMTNSKFNDINLKLKNLKHQILNNKKSKKLKE